MVPLKLLTAHEPKEFTLELLKSTFNSDSHHGDSHHKKERGQIVVELTYDHFKENSDEASEHLEREGRKENGIDRAHGNESPSGAGLLVVSIYGADDVEGENHSNPYVFILFRGEKKKTKVSLTCLRKIALISSTLHVLSLGICPSVGSTLLLAAHISIPGFDAILKNIFCIVSLSNGGIGKDAGNLKSKLNLFVGFSVIFLRVLISPSTNFLVQTQPLASLVVR